MLVHVIFPNLHCFLQVTGQKSLIKALLGREHRVAAEEHTQELELRHIPPNDDEADGQGVARNSPTGPHNVVQKIAAMMMASDDRPVLEP